MSKKLLTNEQFIEKHQLSMAFRRSLFVDGMICGRNFETELKSKLQPEHRWEIVTNFPDSHFGMIDIEKLEKVFSSLKKESNHEVLNYYLSVLDHRFFSMGWGWFERGGRGLSTFSRKASDISEKEKQTAVKTLKLLKKQFCEFGYRPVYGSIDIINTFIRIYGGTVKSADQIHCEKIDRIKAASGEINNGVKYPRKLKKYIQKQTKESVR